MSHIRAEIAGDLAVTTAGGKVFVKGTLTGLPKDMKDAGIHIHTGTDCADPNAIGGHLMSNLIDGWAYPVPTTYDTTAAGGGTIDVSTKCFVLEKGKGTSKIPNVEERCVVLHGVSTTDLSSRVAIGQIEKDGDGYSATIGKYPGPNALATTPAGNLAVTLLGMTIRLQGSLTGLGKDLKKAGIHIHSGTDCTGGSNNATKAAVNAVIGGHLKSHGDGFVTTKYSTNAQGESPVDISTPADGYKLLSKDKTDDSPAVEGRCIVLHDANNARIGVAKIVCTNGVCKAKAGAYPKIDTKTADDSVAKALLSMSVLMIYTVIGL